MSTESNDLLVNPIPTTPAPDLTPVAPPSLLRKTFIGADGLRAGWSLLIFLVLLGVLLFGVNRIAHRIHPPSPKGAAVTDETSTILFVVEGVIFLAVLLVSWVMSRIERRPSGVYGLGGRRKLALFLAGLAWGIICLSLLVLLLWRTGLLVIEGRMLFGSDILRYGAMWLGGFLLVGLLEEYLTRGYMQYTLTRGLAGLYRSIFKTRNSEALGFWSAAVLFSALFGLGHSGNPGESPVGVFAAGLAGMVFCYSLWRTRSLWWAVGFHASWDWGQSYLYGVADSGMMLQHHLLRTHPAGRPILSGGTTGPEGSIFILAVFVLIVVIITVTLPRNADGYIGNRALVSRDQQGLSG